MRFFYDSTGKRVGFANGTMLFYYLYNVQGDVIAIVRAATGQIVAKYSYDAWGNCTVTNAAGYAVGDKNPFRYRGYYYDTETGLYYLNSRYYNPEFGRFISADGLIDNRGATSQNLFAYCGNNPINDSDPDGTLSLLAKIAIGIGAVVVGAAIVAATAGTASVFLGAVVMGLKSAALSGAISAAVGAGYSAVEHRISTGSWSGAEKAAIGGAVDGAADGFMWGGISAGATFTTVAAKGVKIQQIGRLKPTNKSGKGYQGVQYKNQRGSLKSIELHSPHKSGPHQLWHWQQNTWNPKTGGITGRSIHWTLFGRRF